MNSKLRVDWLSVSLEGDEVFRQGLMAVGEFKPIPGIPLYLHGYDLEYARLYVQDELNDNYPTACVIFNHAILYGGQYDRIYDIMLRLTGIAGFISYHLTRVDLSVMVDHNFLKDGVEGLMDMVRGKVQRKTMKHYGSLGVTETVYFGNREKLLVRIYDKHKELLSAKGTKAFKRYVWDDVSDWEECYNVEFELHRKWLKDANIETIGDLFGKLEEEKIWRYLTHDYLRLEKDDSVIAEWCEVMGAVWMSKGFMYEEFIDYAVKEVDSEKLYSVIKGLVNRLCSSQDVETVRHRVYGILKGVRSGEGRSYERKVSIRRVSENTGEDTTYYEKEIQEVVD